VAAVTRYVNTASSGGDGTTNATSGGTAAYASLSSFDANYSASATDDLTVECCGGSDTAAFDYDLATTPNSTLIRANPSEPDGLYTGDDAISTAHYYLNRGTSTAFAVKIREPNTTLQNIQIVHASIGAFDNAVSLANGSHVGVVFDGCSIRAAGAGCFGYGGADPGTLGGTLTIRNCLLVLTAGTAAINLDTANTQSLAVQFDIYQNTIYSNGAKPGVRVTTDWNGTNAQTFNIKNNVVANTTDPFSLQADSGNRVTNTDYNWTDAGTDGTTNEQNLPASPFTSAGSTNGSQFTLTEALATGAAVGSITTDKRGTTRGSPPDAGAYEFVESGSTSVVTAISTEHTQSADNTTFFQSHVFVAIDATQAHTADTAAFVQTHILVAQDASHDHTAGETNFNATQALTVADATQGHTADEATLSQTHILVGADQTQAHTADETTFTVQGGLVVADTSHDHTVDAATLAQTHALVVADASHSVSADNATLAQTHILAADSATHGHTVDATDFVSGVLLLVDDTAQGHSSDAATFAQTHLLVCADAEHGHAADEATMAQIHALVVANATHGMDSDVVDLDSFIPGPATLNTLTLDARRPGVTFDVTTGRSVSV
jgi:hypothetical protein